MSQRCYTYVVQVFLYNYKMGKKIESQNLKKTGQDNIVRKTNAKFKKPRCIGCRDMMHLV